MSCFARYSIQLEGGSACISGPDHLQYQYQTARGHSATSLINSDLRAGRSTLLIDSSLHAFHLQGILLTNIRNPCVLQKLTNLVLFGAVAMCYAN
ncbi:hypothetical protein PoB_004740200 [Plakobranchus ocellatus]|uniref:Uncharacterized protein n=1 Tax=Plakobranchus ocellatus TaxID=259542 RepID=A0AAV4BPL2_9GAST|nr:hypothetical protein PoB_004740200 [Plakobranchus ocellatus]